MNPAADDPDFTESHMSASHGAACPRPNGIPKVSNASG